MNLLKDALNAASSSRQHKPPQPKGTPPPPPPPPKPADEDFIALAPDSDDEQPKRPSHSTPQARPSAKKRNSDHLNNSAPRNGYASRHDAFAPNRSAPWTWGIDWSRHSTVADMLHEEVKAFSEYLSPTPEEHEVRQLIIKLIENCVRRQWPEASVKAFGSFETRLYHPLGDIDLVICSERLEMMERKHVLYQLSHALKREGLADNVQVIAKARVPIIKFRTTHGRFAVDISVNQDNGIASGRIVNGFLQELPALRPLAMTVKAFLRERNMNEVYNGGLGSYSTVCLLVSFLQMHPKIRLGEIRAEDNLGTMLIEFLELYGHLFNVEEVGVSLRDGGSYFRKSHRGWQDPNKPFLLSIEDPQDTDNDVSKGSFQIRQVFRTFAGANEMLTAAAYQRAAAREAKREGHYTQLHQAQEMGILGSIMSVDNETINHRQMVKELYDTGVLHEWLGVPKTMLAPLVPPAPPAPPKDTSRLRDETTLDYDSGEQDMEMSEAGAESSDSAQDTRYRMVRNGRAQLEQMAFTTDEEDDHSSLGDIIPNMVLHTAPSSPSSPEVQMEEVALRQPRRANVKIDRNRAFWAAKAAP
ncbi:Nucleotidyltransferase [Auricularia subglabra TFB-10046 SS5]|nr:Nucleotidyltransferase [Auricularia subglabra TFB-10046 SS5]